MILSLYNTLTKSKEIFVPENSSRVKLYVCGPTVYGEAHIGNARCVTVFDVLYRILMKIYGDVLYVRNITDIDDKILDKCKELSISVTQLTTDTTNIFHEHMKYINCLSPSIEPKATEHVDEMIAMIQSLVESGYAYKASDDNVYFKVSKAKDYTNLSGRILDNMLDGVRIENNSLKKSHEDFVLWKPASDNDVSDANFASPFGNGRPGWHIECSAMCHKYLGENFDIHGGGIDLIFPHHTNEIAQSTSAFPGSRFANFWIHNGFLTVNGEKMSKSLGNIVTIGDLITKNIRGEVIRLFLLSGHYRKPLDYSLKSISDAKKMLDYWYRAIEIDVAGEYSTNLPDEFIAALLDDINTPQAIKIINDYAKVSHSNVLSNEKIIATKKLKACANFLGLLQSSNTQWFEGKSSDEEHIKKILADRSEAKKNKDWKQADFIRNELLSKYNIHIEDHSDGTTSWRKN